MTRSAERGRVLLVAAPYYAHIVDALERGARLALVEAGYAVERVDVPGAFEIPAAIAAAERAGGWAGYVALGCVIRGETSHYDYVCGECARAIMDLTTRDGVAIGFGVLTVENEKQAVVRADVGGRDKGGEAARAAMALMRLNRRFAAAPASGDAS